MTTQDDSSTNATLASQEDASDQECRTISARRKDSKWDKYPGEVRPAKQIALTNPEAELSIDPGQIQIMPIAAVPGAETHFVVLPPQGVEVDKGIPGGSKLPEQL